MGHYYAFRSKCRRKTGEYTDQLCIQPQRKEGRSTIDPWIFLNHGNTVWAARTFHFVQSDNASVKMQQKFSIKRHTEVELHSAWLYFMARGGCMAMVALSRYRVSVWLFFREEAVFCMALLFVDSFIQLHCLTVCASQDHDTAVNDSPGCSKIYTYSGKPTVVSQGKAHLIPYAACKFPYPE